MASLTDDDIKKLLVREIRASKSTTDTELADKRRRALEYFNGEMKDTPAETGRSSVVSRDLADTVGWMVPQIMSVFAASDQMVIAEPVAENDEDQASDATALLNYIFWKDNPGYRILRDVSWDSLVLANGVIKLWNDDTPEYVTSFHSGLDDDQLKLLESTKGVEITHQTSEVVQEEAADETGAPTMVDVNVHEVKIKRLASTSRRRIECIPPEDYFRSDEPPSDERPRFEAQRIEHTRSDLIEMGFDRSKVDDLGTTKTDDLADQARENSVDSDKDAADKSMETIEVFECYLRADVDDDGIAETVRAYYAGNKDGGTLLDWEVWEDEGPFYDVPCDPVPHRWDGKSIADETMDIQRVKTVLWRQGLDNTYATNNPQRFVKGKILNPDELFSPSFGGAIFGDATASVENLSVPFVANHAYEALTYADEIIQRRTGQGRQSMALDPDVLQNQTATANQNNKDAAYSQVELVVRDMAMLGWTPIFRGLLKLEIKHQDRPRRIRLGKKVLNIDPRSWNADMHITINIGLGTGSRDRDMAMLNNVLNGQLMLADKLYAAGDVEGAIELLPKIIATMTKIAESAGLRNPQSFYPDYTDEKVAQLKTLASQPKANPKLEEIKANGEVQAQLKQVDAQVTVQTEAAKLQANQQSEAIASEAQVRREQAQLDADLATKEADRQNALVLEAQKQAFEREKLDREYQFKMWDAEQNRQLERDKMANAATIAANKPEARPGV